LVHDDQDELVAGLCGHTWGGCCEIRQVWVHESLRGQGLGRQLLESAEAEAKYRKCSQIILTTHSFQAPNLYRRLGYELVATLDDYPQGHSQLIFRKRSGSLGCSIPDEPLPRSNTTTEFNSRT
jgi:ribosomal protein S18 acetylase RimI-like enzyme